MIFRSKKTLDAYVKAEAERLLPQRIGERIERFSHNPIAIRRTAEAFYGVKGDTITPNSIILSWFRRAIKAFAAEIARAA